MKINQFSLALKLLCSPTIKGNQHTTDNLYVVQYMLTPVTDSFRLILTHIFTLNVSITSLYCKPYSPQCVVMRTQCRLLNHLLFTLICSRGPAADTSSTQTTKLMHLGRGRLSPEETFRFPISVFIVEQLV